MRYWAYVDGEVQGPFEKEKLTGLPRFGAASLVCPETTAAGETAAWKAAATFPEVAELLAKPPEPAPAPAPAPARAPAAESPLAMTMRGTLISDPVFEEQLGKPLPSFKPSPAPQPAAAAPAAGPEKKAPAQDQAVTLAAIAEGQARLMERLQSVERSVNEMKSLLFPGLQKKE